MDEIQFLNDEQRDALIELYIAYFNRAPEAGGLSFHANAVIEDLNAGLTFEQAYNNRADQFFQAALDLNVYSNAMTSNEFVAEVYENALLRPGPGGDAPTEAELSYWTTLLANGEIGRGDLVQRFLSDTENLIENGNAEEQAVATQVMAVLENRVEVANVFARPENSGGLTGQEAINAGTAAIAGVDETQASVDAAIQDIEEGSVGQDGDVFTLTATAGEQIDGTAGDDTVNGVIGTDQTINNFDDVNGGAGDDTLNAIVDGVYAIPASASISGVETISLAVEAASTGTVDAGDFEGSTTIRQAGALALDVEGLTNQTVVYTDAIANVEYAEDAAAANVLLDGVDDGETLNVDGVDLTSLAVSGTVEEDTSGASPVPGDITITTTNEVAGTTDGSEIETVTVSLESDVDLTVADLTETVTFDASGSTGAISTDLSALVALETATFGVGDDVVAAAISDEADTTFDLGEGDDSFALNGTGPTGAGAANSLTTATLGEGNDTFEVTTDLSNIVDASDDEFENGLIAVADFNGDEDVVDLSLFTAGQIGLNNVQQSDVEDEATLADALDTAASYDTGDTTTPTDDFVVFEYDGSTYIYADQDESGDFSNGDGLVELVGFTGDLDGNNLITA